MHIAQHVFDGVMGLDPAMYHPAIIQLVDIHRIGITEQIVHVSKNLLIRTDHEYPQQIILALAQLMHRQTAFDALFIHVMADLAVGVTGQVLQHGAAQGLLIQPVERHDRQHLVDGPGIRQALEYREVADVFVCHLVIQLIQHLAVGALAGLEQCMQSIAQRKIALLGQRLLRQRDLALGILPGHVAHVVSRPPVGLGNHLDIGLPEQADQSTHHLRQLIQIIDRRHRIVMPFHIGHLHHQHRVMGGHCPPAFGKDMRVRQPLLITEFAQHLHHGAGIFGNVVIDRAGIARVGAVVIHPQAATNFDMIDRQAQRPQLAKVADRLAESMLIVSQVGDLRAHVEMQ